MMFFSKRKRRDTKNCIGLSFIKNEKRYAYEKYEYREFLRNVKHSIWGKEDMEYLDFFIELLRKELRYSSLLEINRNQSQHRFIYPFDKMFPALLGYSIPSEKIKIDIQECNLVSEPWHHGRYRSSYHLLKKTPFEYDKSDHSAIYYDGLNMTCAYNGLHSLGVGVYLGGGIIEAEYYDVRKIFDIVDVEMDLCFVYNREKIKERFNRENKHMSNDLEEELEKRFYGTDYRLILIYELCKMRYTLQQEAGK